MGRLALPVSRESYNDAFKRSVAALRDADVPFACMGSLALWALGGPAPNLQQDLDFAICETDVAEARQALADAGFTIEQPPEDWLFKAWNHGIEEPDSSLVDLIFRPAGIVVTHELLDRCEERSLLALDVRVLDATELLVTKLHAVTEQNADFSSTLQFARSLRERVDWTELARRSSSTPFGVSFLVLVELLGIAPRDVLSELMQRDLPLRELLGSSSARGIEELPGSSELEDVAQAVAEHADGAMLDVRLGLSRGRIVLRGEAANERHRLQVEQLVHERLPALEIDNALRVREYAAPSVPPEQIP